MMRAKKLTAAIMAAMLTISAQSALAKYSVDSNVYSFSYESTVSNPLPINVICLKPGVTPADITDDNFSEVIVFADDATVPANSKAEMEFSIPEGMEEGTYSVWVYTAQYKEPKEAHDTFYYPSSTGIKTMLDEFNADGADYAALFAEYTAEDKLMLEAADPKDEYYAANTSDVNALIAGNRPYASCGDVDDAFTDAILTDKLNKADSTTVEAVTDSLFEYKGIEAPGSYKAGKQAVMSEFLAKKTAFTDTDSAMKSLENIAVLALVNSTVENSKMQNIIKDYADYIGVDYDAYVAAGADAVNRYLFEKGFTTVADIKTAVENGIDAQDNGGTVSNPGNSNKPSSSKGGGSFSVQDTAVVPVQTGFTDMASAQWALEAVNSLAAEGIVSGDGNGTFRPGDSVTREEFLKMILVAFDFNIENTSVAFGDVAPGAWYAPYVATAYNSGITKGKSDTAFGVGDSITREEMAVFIARAAEKINKPVTAVSSYDAFADEADVSAYALEAVRLLQNAQIINGMADNRFCPSELSTRAQAAVIIYRAMANIEKGAMQ